ncbi:MAG: S1 RNA-binding domain-containing protein [Candidatus Nomurabacteria bacterium]|jgi:small subunit ribosomal protein S1|nr:S1 RNA-binding domain-containing protein [Candidatus Nomurabacteria bacterium]
MATKQVTMDDLLAGAADVTLETGASLEATILTVKKNEIVVDLGIYGIGIVPKREIGFGKTYEVGEVVTVSVIEADLGDDIIVSLRKAAKDKGWDEIQTILEKGETIEIVPYDANRGGLMIEYEGVRGFMPVSQLSAEHYPRVGSESKDEILNRLNALVGHPMKAQILDVDKKQNKLIFSEKEAIRDGLEKKFASIKVGDTVKGKITGVVDFGAFVNVDGIEGMIHISEISWERVVSPSDFLKVGDEVEAKIIAIDKDRLSLSIKQLQDDPWVSEADKFKVGDKVEGTITRITPFGAFVQISPAVEALVHISELGKRDGNPEKMFTLNEKKEFKIVEVNKEARKISLGLVK